MRYFSHDTNASSDELIIQLRMEHGGAAVDAYWTILEYIYGEEQPMPFGRNRRETKSVMHRLCLGFDEYETLQKFVSTMVEIGLLISRKSPKDECEFLSSSRANEAIEAYAARKETARQNGKKGGRPRKPSGIPNVNPEETKSVSTSVSETKPNGKPTESYIELKGKETHKGFPIPSAGAAAGEPAPRAGALKAQADMAEQSRLMAEMEASAVPCPAEVAEAVAEVLR